MTAHQVKAIGNLLTGYRSDLTYIRNFHRFKSKRSSEKDYCEKSEGTFKSFIDDFRVARNVEKNKTRKLLSFTLHWVHSKNANDVDAFAHHLCKKGITHGKTMTSLSSKILFLNNSWEIFPFDSIARNALCMKKNVYADYLPLVHQFRKKQNKMIQECIKSVSPHLSIIEKEFVTEIHDIKTVRTNRFIDKLLWTTGS